MNRSKKNYMIVGHGEKNQYARLSLPPELAPLIGESVWIEWEEGDFDRVILHKVKRD